MRISASALLRVCLLASVPIASMAQATGDRRGGKRITRRQPNYRNRCQRRRQLHHRPACGEFGRHSDAGSRGDVPGHLSRRRQLRAVRAHLRRARLAATDDSFYVPNGFNTTTNWAGPYNTSTGGATAPGAGVSTTGSAGQNVWKWVRLTSIPGIGDTSIGPTAWVVPDGALTQTFPGVRAKTACCSTSWRSLP